jgi:hypothetical protein
MKRRSIVTAIVVAGVAVIAAAAFAATSVKTYTVAVGDEYSVTPLFSVNDEVPVLGGASGAKYRMVGIPDGLGAHANKDGTSTLYMNHEFRKNVLSQPYVGATKNRGAIVSKWILNANGDPIAGKRAYDEIFIDDTKIMGGVALEGNSQPAFARFCSGFLAGPAEGFDRWIYFANEESGGADTFDGKGGLSVAIFDNSGVGEAHGLPYLGRFSWENTLVQRGTGDLTVIMGMEDGESNQDPANDNSQLYMYVGVKDHSPGATILERNGLTGGRLYAFRSTNKNRNSEFAFRGGTLAGEWVEIAGAAHKTDAELETATDAVGAMVFARPEDGAFNPVQQNEFFFVTTGDIPTGGSEKGQYLGNTLGRLYSLRLNPSDPTRNATLSVIYNADEIVAAGGDTALSPDNIDASAEYLMINEDGTTESRKVMAAKGRDGSIWRWTLKPSGGVHAGSAVRVAELDPPGRNGSPPDAVVNPGVWETSGIIDTASIFGPDTWLFDAQAHSPTPAPGGGSSVTVEDGQLLILRPKS